MTKFKIFADLVAMQVKSMSKTFYLFRTQVSKEELWNTYLNSFPEGTNPIFRERTEHDCQCCKQFIRAFGNVVAINEANEVISIWDIQIDNFYQEVANAMSALVKSRPIENVFLHYEKKIGREVTYEGLENNGVRSWNHFYAEVPKEYVTPKADIDSVLSVCKSTRDVYLRSLNEISLDAIETVLELIDTKAIYRGEEFQNTVRAFKTDKQNYIAAGNKENLVWNTFQNVSSTITNIRNTLIGTLLTDISEGVPLEIAVNKYESKAAPENYKRTSAIITQSMIKRAQNTVETLGLTSALNRRFAVIEDVAINDVLFANRAIQPLMINPFDQLATKTKDTVKFKDTLESINIEDFIQRVLPNVNSLEILLETRHEANMMSLVAPVDPQAGNLFKWNNNFSWAYNGDVTDSIKQRVKAAGGSVDGDLRCSLSWFNYDDLDIHLTLPNGRKITFNKPEDYETGGRLDVDMNAGGGNSREAVENITFSNKTNLLEGTYKLEVHNYCKRETADEGFIAEIEFAGQIWNFTYDRTVRSNEKVLVAEFVYSRTKGITMVQNIDSKEKTKEVWGLTTGKFHTVDTLMLSPNHWGGQTIGNKHYCFILKNCLNPEPVRGFFNEYLDDRLREHRKVFEVLGAQMKTPISSRQLSGLGFSSTKENQITCRVKGNITRVFNIKF